MHFSVLLGNFILSKQILCKKRLRPAFRILFCCKWKCGCAVDQFASFFFKHILFFFFFLQVLMKFLKIVLIYRSMRVLAKIETLESLHKLEEIIEASDGIMVARGDLGVEIPLEKIPIMQEEIVNVCRQLNKPVIVASQLLESMIEYPTPTRAEVLYY